MWAKQTVKSGFTIVELLIVIVVIGILAAITIVAYNGVQNRANDTARQSDVKSIQRALELYKADNGRYPTAVTSSTVSSACPVNPGDGYSYSFTPDDSWLKPLIDAGYLTSVPKPTVNDCTHYYRYLYRPAGSTNYNCALTTGYYILQVAGTSGSITPQDSAAFKPCPAATVTWGVSATNWAFGRFEQ